MRVGVIPRQLLEVGADQREQLVGRGAVAQASAGEQIVEAGYVVHDARLYDDRGGQARAIRRDEPGLGDLAWSKFGLAE